MGEQIPSTEPVNLPEGYHFTDSLTIKPEEIIALRESVGWDGGSAQTWQQCIEQPGGVIVGVKNADGTLVGMGRITPDPRHAVLCDLVVRPADQSQGIGKALVQKRIQIAEEKQIPYLYTDLAEDNPLRDLYTSVGFITTGGSLFRAKLSE